MLLVVVVVVQCCVVVLYVRVPDPALLQCLVGVYVYGVTPLLAFALPFPWAVLSPAVLVSVLVVAC